MQQLAPQLSEFAFIGLILALSGIVAALISDRNDRKYTLALVFFGFLSSVLKIYLIQKTQQWTDTPLDSFKYQLHAQAFVFHWQGMAVSAEFFKLDGLKYIFQMETWEPDSISAYSSVLGTHEWMYAAYLGLWAALTDDWIIWASYSQAAFSAIFPACAYCICRKMGSNRTVATAAAIITLIDFSTAINASWLLKDTIACWLFSILIIASVSLIRQPNVSLTLLITIVSGLLAGFRYVGFLAFIATFLALTPYLLIKKHFKTFASLFAACAGGCLLFGLLTSVPVQSTADALSKTASLFVAILEGQQDTLESSRLKDFDASSVDSSTADWLERLHDNPAKAIATAAVRTMFAPYPWVLFSQELSGNGVELYYLSSIAFALCLPGTIWLFIKSAHRPTASIAFVALILGACLCAYVIFLGEWSTRQRVFMMPVYFGLAAIGWDDLRKRMSYRRFNDARQLD